MTKTQVEVITSVQRRRRWSRADKERIVAAAMEPGTGRPLLRSLAAAGLIERAGPGQVGEYPVEAKTVVRYRSQADFTSNRGEGASRVSGARRAREPEPPEKRPRRPRDCRRAGQDDDRRR